MSEYEKDYVNKCEEINFRNILGGFAFSCATVAVSYLRCDI
jgi:hypothetical protein